jgi:hypothetical protein
VDARQEVAAIQRERAAQVALLERRTEIRDVERQQPRRDADRLSLARQDLVAERAPEDR